MCKVSLLKARISILSRLLQCFLKVLQNRSEKLKNAFPKTRNAILLGVFSDFQTSHTIFTIKLQTFEVRDSELHFARQKQCFGENYAPDCCKSGPLRQKWCQTAARKRKNSKKLKTSRNAGGKSPAPIRHKAGFTTIVKSEPQSLPRCLGNMWTFEKIIPWKHPKHKRNAFARNV